ncbi:MAG TPA: hypothetical protein VEJ63_07390 [Planctomycetota bacterium]|nr:hypothetical protein [Planctomycetota bacterium]
MNQTHDSTVCFNDQERVVLLRILEHYGDGIREERRRTEDHQFRDELKNEMQLIQGLAEKIRHSSAAVAR